MPAMTKADSKVPMKARARMTPRLLMKASCLQWYPELKMIGGRKATKNTTGSKSSSASLTADSPNEMKPPLKEHSDGTRESLCSSPARLRPLRLPHDADEEDRARFGEQPQLPNVPDAVAHDDRHHQDREECQDERGHLNFHVSSPLVTGDAVQTRSRVLRGLILLVVLLKEPVEQRAHFGI
eukprot:scaffold8449_cov277-Pinguiococcus_pyrenoidosus.AAC.3